MHTKEELLSKVTTAAYNVYHALGAGFLESVYANAMIVELRSKGIVAKKEQPLRVCYKDVVVGEFRADLLIEDWLIVELKAVNELSSVHEAQLVNYLNATKQDVGLLINFGHERIMVKRKRREFSLHKTR